MIKPIAALVFALPFVALAQSLPGSHVSLYGTVDVAVSHTKSGNNKTTELASSRLETSSFGITGREVIGGGVAVTFDLRQGIDASTGDSAGVAGLNQNNQGVINTFNIESNVGIESEWGALKLGNTESLSESALQGIGLRDSSPTLVNRQADGGTSVKNSLTFHSRKFGGASIHTQVGLGETVNSNKSGQTAGLGVSYSQGPIDVRMAYETRFFRNVDFSNGIVTTPSETQTVKVLALSGSYTMANKIKIAANYATNKQSSTNHKLTGFSIGASLPVGQRGEVAADVGSSTEVDTNGNEAKVRLVSVHGKYHLSKRTTAYLGVGTKKPKVGEKETWVDAGMAHRF